MTENGVGLTTDEARRRLAEFGPNSLDERETAPWLRFLAKFSAPVPWMLEAAVALQLVLGKYVEAAVIGMLVVFNAALAFFQEARAQATLDALKTRLALIAVVRRDGVWSAIPGAELVPGDLVKLSLGGVVGADLRLLEGEVLLDQSMLTGESLPVEAGPGASAYAGALVRRGEAVAEVTATGRRTRFGHTAELVRTAHVVSSQQKAVLRVVRNLAIFNGFVVLFQTGYGLWCHLPFTEIVPLTLTAVLAAIPVALPASFTLATALAARALAKRDVLPTRLSAVDEAATMDVLCSDKTGTLTRNELAVAAIEPIGGFGKDHVLALAALASADAGQDPVDAAIRLAAGEAKAAMAWTRSAFFAFDPTTRMSRAEALDERGDRVEIVKGAFAEVRKIAQAPNSASASVERLQAQGFRVLGVAAGAPGDLRLAGFVALSDPPRADSAGLIADLRAMGVGTVMLTGDAPTTATVVARAVGIEGAVHPPGAPPASVTLEDYGVFAGVFPEDKFAIVKAFQAAGHTVGMCGDGANDAPALRQAQIGIAVSTATDVAKSAAGIVLTRPGLEGVLAAVREGRAAFQRILTYALRSLTRKLDQLLFLTFGLVLTGHAILTPMLMVILMSTGDFLAMAATTDNVTPSEKPNVWRIDALTGAAVVLALCDLAFCSGVLAYGKFQLALSLDALRTLAAVTLVACGQAVLLVVRERRAMWRSRPSGIFLLASCADLAVIAILATQGIFMAPLPARVVVGIFVAAAVFAVLLDRVKLIVFRRFRIS
ncbi:HAD-IC family P-type ATPase [Rhodoblastus sp.]|uniref:HAD-IC family P-type ATPase n=1 Tax=Rhodoblastus sp. TaxID=1962975 RepID=UPI0035B12734